MKKTKKRMMTMTKETNDMNRDDILQTKDDMERAEYFHDKEIQSKEGLISELIDTLKDVLNQACSDGNNKLDSMALTSYARGLRLLSKLGHFNIKKEHGRRVIGEMVWDEKQS